MYNLKLAALPVLDVLLLGQLPFDCCLDLALLYQHACVCCHSLHVNIVSKLVQRAKCLAPSFSETHHTQHALHVSIICLSGISIVALLSC